MFQLKTGKGHGYGAVYNDSGKWVLNLTPKTPEGFGQLVVDLLNKHEESQEIDDEPQRCVFPEFGSCTQTHFDCTKCPKFPDELKPSARKSS